MSFPTQLTVLRIVLAPIFFLLFAVAEPSLYTWAAIVFILGALSDWYDGYFARLWKLTTPLGAFLDPLADKLLTSAALIGFASKGFIPLWAVLIIIARDVYITIYRILADRGGQPIKTSILAKYKTFFQMVFICYVLLALLVSTGTFGISFIKTGQVMMDQSLLYWSVFAVALLSLLTAIQYTYDNAQVLRSVLPGYFFKRTPQELS